MKTVQTIAEARAAIAEARRANRKIGFVPTMGFLHEGHLSLMRRCAELADFVVISIYVNPLQFAPGEDLDAYPRNADRDFELARDVGVDLVFFPSDAELYPDEMAVRVVPRRLADRLCGLSRPGHFEGVLTIVAKLFGIVTPDVSVFGQKDFQQSVLIRKMVEDLNMPVEIEVAPTVREPDGLAMSSRNAYLSREERDRALRLSRGLAAAVAAFRAGERDAAKLRGVVRGQLKSGGGVEVEYVEAVTPDDLEPTEQVDDLSVLAAAAHVGSTRLIDNVSLGSPDPGMAELLQKSGV